MQAFHANLIRNIKDHICLSKSSDFEVKNDVTEYSEKDEELASENDSLLSELHNLIEKNRNNKQAVIQKIRNRVKEDFEKYIQEIDSENKNPNQFEIVCVDGENQTRPISKEKFLKSFQQSCVHKVKRNLECHKLSLENIEVFYNNRKHHFLEVSQKQNELFDMLENMDFSLTGEEKTLFEKD